MKRILTAISVLLPLALAGCDSGPPASPKDGAQASAPPQASPSATVPAEPRHRDLAIGSAGRAAQAAAADPAASPTRKALDESRGAMSRATTYMDQGRFDLAEKELKRLKAKRDSLPEFLQVQVDRLDALVRTGAVSEPQRSLKAAIMDSEDQAQRRN